MKKLLVIAFLVAASLAAWSWFARDAARELLCGMEFFRAEVEKNPDNVAIITRTLAHPELIKTFPVLIQEAEQNHHRWSVCMWTAVGIAVLNLAFLLLNKPRTSNKDSACDS